MQRVFVSYSRRNKTFAERIARDLSDAGLDVWIDFRQIHGGEAWQNEIFRGIERSEMVILCVSPAAIASEWVTREVLTAREQDKFILPVMVHPAVKDIEENEKLNWLLDIQFIDFVDRYEEAFPELLSALPGKRRVGVFDLFDPENVTNPFKGLEAFQQTDAAFFFGREPLIDKSLELMARNDQARFLAIMGASGSGKSSLVRAGLLPRLRKGALPASERWPLAIFTPGDDPIDALATRFSPLLGDERDANAIELALHDNPETLDAMVDEILEGTPPETKLLIVIDQFEEVFTRSSTEYAEIFLDIITHAATAPNGRTIIITTMRSDFFDRVGKYHQLAELYEQENMVIVTDMTSANLLRAIEGPAEAVGLKYEDGLPARILDDVRRQPGSLPLLQYALMELYNNRDGQMLTHAAYDHIGGVERALAQHAEDIYKSLNETQQDLMRRILLRLVQVDEDGEPTRRRINRSELKFQGVSDDAIQRVIDLMTSQESRLLIASREIASSDDENAVPVIRLEISHEALVRKWDRYQDWIAANLENLRYSTEILKSAQEWQQSNKDVAYLLRGNRLLQAQEWVENADANTLQTSFIEASIAERDRRLQEEREQAERELALQRRSAQLARLIAVVAIIAFIGAAFLTVWALNERANAEQNAARAEENAVRAAELAIRADENAAQAAVSAERAEENAAEARSFALAANAERALEGNNGDLALALAVESVIATDPPPPEARLSLANVSFAPQTRHVFEESSQVISVSYPENNDVVLYGLGNGRFVVAHVRSGETLHSIPIDNSAVSAITTIPDTTIALVGLQNGVITSIDYEVGEIIETFTPRHENAINHLSISSRDGDLRFVSSSRDGSVVVSDYETGSVLANIEVDSNQVMAAFIDPQNPDQVYAASRNGIIRLYDLNALTMVKEGLGRRQLYSMDISDDGDVIVTGNADGIVSVWSQSDDEIVLDRELSGHDSNALILSVKLDHTGTFVASGATDETVLIFDVTSGNVIETFSGHSDTVNILDFNPSSKRLISGSNDLTVRVWDVVNAAIIADYAGNDQGALGLYMPNNRAMVSSSFDGTIRLWDIATGRIYQQLNNENGVIITHDISHDGSQVVAGNLDATINVWDLRTGEALPLIGHDGAINAASYLPDELKAITVGRDGKIIVWDLDPTSDTFTEASKTLLPVVEEGRRLPTLNALAIDAEAKLLAVGGEDELITIWDLTTDEVIQTLSGHDRSIRALAFSADGNSLVSGTTNGDIYLWNVETGEIIQQFVGHNLSIQSLGFSPDGENILSAAFDGTIRVWDIATAFEVRVYQLEDKNLRVRNVVFNTSGENILSGMSNGNLRRWRLYPTIDSMLAWTINNRYVRELTCTERERFRVEPQCDEDGASPERVLPELPDIEPEPITVLSLQIGDEAIVNTNSDDSLRLRSAPTLDSEIIENMSDGSIVTLIESDKEGLTSPTNAEDFKWWFVRTEDGLEGWAVEFFTDTTEDIYQSLVPVSAFVME